MKYKRKSIINFGMYKGEQRTIQSLLTANPAYLEWCVENIDWFEVDDDLKSCIKEASAKAGRESSSGFTHLYDPEEGNPWGLSILDLGYDGDGF